MCSRLLKKFKKNEKSWRDFLWKGTGDGRNVNCIKWSKISSPNSMRGLGSTKANNANFALLSKWL